MSRLASIERFHAQRDALAARRRVGVMTAIIAAGSCGRARGADAVVQAMRHEIEQSHLGERLSLRVTGCHGLCALEPAILVRPSGTLYPNVKPADVPRIVLALAAQEVLSDLLWVDPATGAPVERRADIGSFAKQVRTLLGRHEQLDPHRIDDFIATGGYAALLKALGNGPEWVREELESSRLRSRGGTWWPVGPQLQALATRGARPLVCGGGDATIGGRLLEANPHAVIEGLLIAALATSAREGIIQAGDAAAALEAAVDEAFELGLLGERILGTELSFSIRVTRGAGDDLRGLRLDAETWTNVPVVIDQGADRFRTVGTASCPGTKLLSLSGNLRYTGLVEVALGTSLQEILGEIGGGPSDSRALKAVQLGGPSGGCIPSSRFATRLEPESLDRADIALGSDRLIALDEGTCMVELARGIARSCSDRMPETDEAARLGTQRVAALLDDIVSGRAAPGAISEAAALGETASQPALWTVGQIIEAFGDEFRRHVCGRRCDAFVCQDLVGAPCQAACPLGTDAGRSIAYLADGRMADAYRVLRHNNPFPSVCIRLCGHPCEARCKLIAQGHRPVAIRKLQLALTEAVSPSAFRPRRHQASGPAAKIAVIGAGPAGLTAAHGLSMRGHDVTVFDAEREPGGMLLLGVPDYHLPREILRREIAALTDDEGITLRMGCSLGREVTLDSLFGSGYRAILLAVGAQRSRRLHLDGEDMEGTVPALAFLRAFNLEGRNLARGRVGVVGGGHTAVHAARVATRAPGVESVTLFHSRSRLEMQLPDAGVEAALAEGVVLRTHVSPRRVLGEHGRLSGLELVRTGLGKVDGTGRCITLPLPGTEHVVALDTLIVAVAEQVRLFPPMGCEGVAISTRGTLVADENLALARPGLFACGDAVSGPAGVAAAVASGNRAAALIDAFVRGEKAEVDGAASSAALHDDQYRHSSESSGGTRLADGSDTTQASAEAPCVLQPPRGELDTVEARRCLRCNLELPARPPRGPPHTAQPP